MGVILMLQPEASVLGWYAALPVAAAVFIAFRDILTRRLGAVDDPATILFYTVTVSVVAGAGWMLLFGANYPSASDWAVFGCAVFSGAAFACATTVSVDAVSRATRSPRVLHDATAR